MANMREKSKVLIVGAGPAGAALAQILRKNHIAFEIFEREETFGIRRGGCFGLDSCLAGLEEVLPTDLGPYSHTSVNAAISTHDDFCFIDAETNSIKAHFGAPHGTPGFLLQARRDDFRAWITQHLPIQTGKKFSYYTETPDAVTAHFADGTSSSGALLIGANGASSCIRAQLLDHPERKFFEQVVITGEMVLKPQEFQEIESLAAGAVVAYKHLNHSLLLRLDVAPDRSWSRYWWMQTFFAEDPEAAARWVTSASRGELYAKALAGATEQGSLFSNALRAAGPESVWQPQIVFTEWSPPDTLPEKSADGNFMRRVTLLGDAGHNTLSFGAVGANISMMDSCDLGKAITEAGPMGWSERHALKRIVSDYEKVMLPRGQAVVAHSHGMAYGRNGGTPGIGDRLKTDPRERDWWRKSKKEVEKDKVDKDTDPTPQDSVGTKEAEKVVSQRTMELRPVAA